MKFSIEIKRSAQKSLAKIAQPYQDRIIDAINKLASNPRPNDSKKLSGRDAWRLRIGDYRVIYEIYNKKLVIEIIEVGHRGQVYR